MLFRRAISLLAIGAAGTVLLTSAKSYAGGFALREQSAYGQGSSFAGIAAGGDLSAMFWNPAVMTQFGGIQTSIVGTGVFPSSKNIPDPTTPLVALGGTGNTADAAFVPSGYFSYQLNPNFWVGLSFNAPFGLSVGFPTVWAGASYAGGDSHLRTYNATPSIAYRFNDWISVGFGVQFQYADAALTRFPVPGAVMAQLEGKGWAYGVTAGLTVTPTPWTTIGLGYRSQMNQELDGSQSVTGLGTAPANLKIRLPDMVSLGIRQRLSQQWTLLGTAEWSNWSRIGTASVSGGVVPGTTLPFQFDDGWFFSLGAEYQWTDRLAVRAGVGYEISPISDAVRIPILPDNDRIWLSLGMSAKLGPGLTADFGYSHVFVKDAPINIGPGHPWFNPAVPIPYIGNVESHVDIVSFSLRYRWDEPAPVVKTSLPTK